MGWGRMLLLGDWGQQMDIQDQKREIEELRLQMETGSSVQDADNLKSRISQLEMENGELRLYLASLIRYLGHKGIIRQDELKELIKAVDKEDGSSDGAYSGKILK